MAILNPKTPVTTPKPKQLTNPVMATNRNLANPHANNQSEIDRTRSVIEDRYMAGQDLTAQLAHYKNLTGKDYTKSGDYQGLAVNKSINDTFNKSKGYLDSLYNSQRDSQLAAMRAQRDKAIGQINQQKAKVAPQYQGMRNQTDAVNAQNVQRLREVMAANGLNASGENVSANVAMNNERVNSLNSLNLQEQQTMNGYDQQIMDINNPAEEQALIAQIEAQRSQALMDAYSQAQNQGYQRYRDTIGDQRYSKEWSAQEQQRRMDNAWRTHTFNNMSAADKKQFEWAKAQFGEEQAWRMFELEYQGELAKSQTQAELEFYNSGFNNAEGGGDYSKYKVSSPFGIRKDPIDGTTKMHNSVDIAMPKGAPVPSTVGGTVVYAGFGQKGSGYGGYGNVVVVRDSMGNLHQYSHLDSIGVKVGQKVASGALVGKAGSTGRSTGPHLDYSVKTPKGKYIDPMAYIG